MRRETVTGIADHTEPQQPCTPAVPAAVGAGGVVHAARIAWRRARSFNILQPGPPTRAGALLGPWLWPFELLGVAHEAPRIRRLSGASVTLTGAARGRPDPAIFAAAAAAYLAFLALLIVAGTALSTVIHRFTGVAAATATLLALIGLFVPLLTEVGRRVIRVLRHPENRGMHRRRRELAERTGRPVLIMTALVRTAPGEGAALLAALRTEWNRDDVIVILNPANKSLVDYYERQGAVVDGDSWRRMTIHPTHGEPATQAT